MKKLIGWLKKVTPLRITVGIATVFALTHFIVESDFFEFGPLSKRGLIHLLDLKALDLKFVTRGKVDAEPKVVIAAIDEKSVERYGLWPFSRTVTADLIDNVTKGGAKVLGFDAVFSDEDRNASYQDIKRFLTSYQEAELLPGGKVRESLAAEAKSAEDALATLQNNVDDLKGKKIAPADRPELMRAIANAKKAAERYAKLKEALELIGKRSDTFYQKMEHTIAAGSPDEALRKAIAASPITVMGYFNFYTNSEIVGVKTEEIEESIHRIDPVAISQIFELGYQEVGGSEVEVVSPVADAKIENLQIRPIVATRAPLKRFADVSKAFGYFNVIPDPDGPMRRIRLLNRYGDKLYPALTLATAAKYFDGEPRPINSTIKPGVALEAINVAPGVNVPTDLHGRLLINYYADPTTIFPAYSIADINEGKIGPEVYKDKVVLFGMTAQGLFDLRPTPFAPDTPGVYVHASAIQNIIDNRYLERYYGLALIEILAYLLLGLLMGLALPRIPAWAGLVATLVFAVGLYFFDVTFVFPEGTWLLNVLPIMQATMSFIGVAVHGYLTEGKEKRKIRAAFQFYLTKNVVEHLLKDPSKLKLGGEKSDCTVLFSDVRGFTTISERLTPEELVSLLNEYLTPMTDIVFKYDGTLDKYIGDAVMAFFGAPVHYTDHAKRACLVALDMMDELHRLQVGWRERGLPELDIGIGLNSGPMVAGNMGSNIKFNYTVMGDNVNLGSRLESINKQYGTNIIISESTFVAAKADIHARIIDAVRVKGKREPVQIYELLGRGPANDKASALIETFELGITTYKAQKWDEAIAIFKKVRDELKPGDYASEMYIERCDHMKADPPGPEWDGVYTMKTK